MKKFIYTVLLICGVININAQTVQATVKKASDNCVTVFALPDGAVNDPPLNYIITTSVPDQTPGTNPNVVVTDILSGMQVDVNTPAPYISSGRYYLDLNFVQIGSPPALNWSAGIEYPIATICFSGATPPPVDDLVQINSLGSGGMWGFSYWYFQVQGAADDITNWALPFYSDPGGMSTASNGADSQAETTESIILPIELEKFHVQKNDLNVDLDWTTATEANASHFEIERSQDGNNWTFLGNVNAVGESSTLQEYSFLDDNLPLNARNNHKTFYYRLNMVDNDGLSDYSDVRSVRFDFDGDADFLVYPNPSFNEVYVNLSTITSKTGPATMQIVNVNGQLVKNVTLSTSDDIRVDVSDLTAGVYHFVAKQGEQTFVQKIIKVE